MSFKRFGAVILAAFLLLPISAQALTNAATTSSYASYNKASAREYVIKFGEEHHLGNNDSWKVYAAPALNAVRGANGKASVHSSGGMDSAGWSGAWLLVRYEKNNGGFRVGWIPKTELNMRTIQATRSVNFAYWTVALAENCALTDDPLLESETLAYAAKGEQMTYLAYYRYKNGAEYAYVQSELDGRPVCGFVPFDAIDW